MQSVYVLQHLHVRPDGDEDYKFIGVYSSRGSALSALDRLRLAPGFRDFATLVSEADDGHAEESGFYLDEHALDVSAWTAGFETVVDAEPAVDSPISPMTAEQQKMADSIGFAQLQAIDQAILTEAEPRWHKVARIVGNLMSAWPQFPREIPTQLYVQRIESLVGRGELESSGDLRRIRYSEVRLTAIDGGSR